MWLLLTACAGPPPEVVPEVGRPGPILGGGLAVAGDLSRWLSDPDRSRLVHVVDGVPTSIPLPEGSLPDCLVVAGDVVVAGLRGEGAAAFVGATDHTVHVVPTCAEPRGVDAAPDGSVWMACADGVLVHLDPTAGAVIAILAVESDLRDVVDDGGDTLWVSRFRTAEILRVDRTTGEVVERLRPPTVDADTEPGLPPDIDPYTPSTAWRMRRHPDGGVIMLHQRGAEGTIDDQPERPNAYGSNSGCDDLVHTTVTTVDPGGEIESSRPINFTGLAIDIAVHANGTIALALLGGDTTVATTNAVRLVQPFAHRNDCVVGVPVIGASRNNEGHGVAVEASGQGFAVAHRLPFGVDGVDLGPSSPVDPGWDLFHRATPSGLACAGCHPEGREDGRTWRFLVEGPRRTQDIAGAGASAPFHWGGELETIDDLLAEVHVRRMGAIVDAAPAEAESLVAFLDRVPVSTPAGTADQPLAAQGATLFRTVGCDTCHTNPPPTGNHDVGTGGAFQVPRLAGVSRRLPVMHDGCAATLYDRFDPECGGTDHGDDDLTGPEINALVAYLSTL